MHVLPLLSELASNVVKKIFRVCGIASAFFMPQFEFFNPPVVRGTCYEESYIMKLVLGKTTLNECITQYSWPQYATINKKNGKITLVYVCYKKPQLLSKVDKSQPQNSNVILEFIPDNDRQRNLRNIQRIKEVVWSLQPQLKQQSAALISSGAEQKLLPEDLDGPAGESSSMLGSEELTLDEQKSEEIKRFEQKISLFSNVKGQNSDFPIDFVDLRHLAKQPSQIKQRYILTAKKIIKEEM